MLVQQIVDLRDVLTCVLGRQVASLAHTFQHVRADMELVERYYNLCAIHVLVLLDVVQTDTLDVVDCHWL
jgi:hypothetical protein